MPHIHILLLGTCDTKLRELLYLRDCILAAHDDGRSTTTTTASTTRVTLLDVGRHATTHPRIDVPQAVLLREYAPASSAPGDVGGLSRGEFIEHMTGCAIRWVRAQGQQDPQQQDSPSRRSSSLPPTSSLSPSFPFHGIIAAGGTGNTSLAAGVMRAALPLGFPKLIVSTNASGDTRAIVGESDITLMNAVVDIAGMNRLLARILANAGAAMGGMAGAYAAALLRAPPAAQPRVPRVGMTMFGVTTACVDVVREELERGYGCECFVFHATGQGGRAMERMVAAGELDGVADVTTTEIADHVVGGIMSAGPDRMAAPLRAGLPYVVSVGAVDMANFGAAETLPPHLQSRHTHAHNASTTLVRTSSGENGRIGAFIAGQIRAHARGAGRVEVHLPLRGVSALSEAGGVFEDAGADEAVREAVRAGLEEEGNEKGGREKVVVRVYEGGINERGFALGVVGALARLMGLVRHEGGGG